MLVEKAHRNPFNKALRAIYPFNLIHSDSCRPMNTKAHDGAFSFLTLFETI